MQIKLDCSSPDDCRTEPVMSTSTKVNNYFGEVTLLVDKWENVERSGGQHIQSALVIAVVDIRPDNVLSGVLLLLQLEDVFHKELLKLLIGKVNAELLKAKQKKHNKETNQKQSLPELQHHCTYIRIVHCFINSFLPQTYSAWSFQSRRCPASLLIGGHRLHPHKVACKQHCLSFPQSR